MTALAVQSHVLFSLVTLVASVLNMKRFIDWNKRIPIGEVSNVEEVQSSVELFSWRKQSSSASTEQHFCKNQNAVDRHPSQTKGISLSDPKEHQQLPNTSSPSINLTTDNSVELRINANNKPEKIDSHVSQKAVTITRRSSKPSRHESVQITTSQTRQHQRDRYINNIYRLGESQLYSLSVSSNGVECYGTNCQPSVFHASHRCRSISSDKDIDTIEKSPLMNAQDIKQNISYISLTNLSNIIDHEPNVSRRDSYSRSTSSILMHKPSLFLANIFNKMTHEQRTKSIAELTKLHEKITESNMSIGKLQRTTSLPNLNKKATKLHSVTSLLSESITANIIQMENKTLSTSLIEQKHMISDPINLETSSTERVAGFNDETIPGFIDQKGHPPMHLSNPLDRPIISSPVKLISLPERKLSEEIIQTGYINNPLATLSPTTHSPTIKPSPIFNKSNTNTSIGKVKLNRSTHFMDADPNDLSSKSKHKPFKTSTSDEINTQFSNLSDRIDVKTIVPSSDSIISSISDTKQQPEKNNQPSKSSSSYNKATDHPSQSKVLSSSPHFQFSNDENETENSLNDVTDHLSQQDTIISYINPNKSFDIMTKESNRTKQPLPLLEKIDEVSQHSKSSDSRLTSPTLLIRSGAIDKEILPLTPTTPALVKLSPINEVDTSMITRTTTASTNLTRTDDDDEQSKLINEQLKRSSLGLARDSLELLRNNTPHHDSTEEQDSTPRKRKSVLKSRLISSDNLPTPEFISYIAIDEIKGDKRLMEKQMRRRSLTVGGGTVISCTSPKPKRDSLILLQERYSGSTTPHSGCYHLSGSDSKHVEFIREPGDTITPALHIGRGNKSKHLSSKQITPSFSNDYYHHFSGHTFDSSERSKSEISISNSQQRFEIGTHSRHPSLDSASRHRTPQIPLTSTTIPSIDTDDIEEEKVCLNKSDYDEMVRLIMTPLSKKKKKHAVKSTCESNIRLCIHNRLTIFQNLILLILLSFFYIFIFIKSQYWQEHNQK